MNDNTMLSSAHVGLVATLNPVPDTITSTVPVEHEHMQVSLLAFAKGQRVTTHSSPRAVVATLLKGEMKFTLEDKTYTMHTGDFLFMAPHAPHSLEALEDACIQLVMMDV